MYGFADHGELQSGDVKLPVCLSGVVELWVYEGGGAGFVVGAEEFWGAVTVLDAAASGAEGPAGVFVAFLVAGVVIFFCYLPRR